MKSYRLISAGLAVLSAIVFAGRLTRAADPPPHITSMSVPEGGSMQIIFHSQKTGPFLVQMRTSLDAAAPWVEIPGAMVTQVQPGVFLALVPKGLEEIAFYRVMSDGEPVVELKGWTIRVQASAPANGQYFVVGESATVTLTLLDTFAQGISRADLSSLSLYMYGPQDPTETVTASKLLNASTDRAARPHHYIDLKTNPDVQVRGNIYSYRLKPVTDEEPGTYTLAVRAALGSDAVQQVMKFVDVQIGTSVVENPVVTKAQCAQCHEGTVSGKMYLHHVDPSTPGSAGSWSIDYAPVRSCKACHNNDGYAAYRDASGGRVVDPIVRRVHGVHMGEGLKLPFNTDPVTGDFHDYVHVKFPADVRSCTKCHVDDRWKTDPSRMACGACHDNIWFGALAEVPAGMQPHPSKEVDDSRCSICHNPDGPGIKPIAEAHAIAPVGFKNVVELAMTPPGNGKFYQIGEAPQLNITVKNAGTGERISPASIVEPLVSTNVQPNEWRRANLYVSGPRARTVPVLTTSAAPDPTHTYANNDLRVRVDPAKEDPRVSRTAESIVYQLDTITNLSSGTYTAFVEVLPSSPLGGWGYVNFQVGTTNVEAMVATNCTDCHENTRMHGSYFAVTFTPDICKNCHDYQRQMPGKVGWGQSNNGFGAAPLARRVHGVHFGRYLEKPEEVHRTYDFSEVIFPQDVRNCTKCHSQTSTWTEKPSRLACLACHDSLYATTHAALMTFDLSSEDPWSGDEIETCVLCHGKDDPYSPKAVHAIANPYVPPYLRDPD